MTRRLNDERGQVIVITVAFLTCLIGAVALTIDVGSWYRMQRQAQTTADAAALAGAQALPDDPANAATLAQTYADKNGGGLDAASIVISSSFDTNDTIKVNVRRTAPGFFAKLFGIDTVNVHAGASARTALPDDARYVAPIVVNIKHPLLSCSTCPRFNTMTTLPLDATGAPGSFALLNLDPNDQNGTIGASELGDWILHGYNDALPLGRYYSDPGAKWNDQPIQDALVKRTGTELLFPVYDVLSGQGSNARYHIVAWVGFHVVSEVANGNSGTITGWFTRYIADGIQAVKSAGKTRDLGVRSIALVQ